MQEAILIAVIGGVFQLGGKWLEHRLKIPRRQAVSGDPYSEVMSEAVSAPGVGSVPLNIGAVIRDVGIILLLTAAAGFVIGMGAGNASQEDLLLAVGFGNIIFGTIGFIISGARTSSRRWSHLAAVAILFWLASGFINVLLLGYPFDLWFMGLSIVLLMMAVGGGLSYLFNRP